MERYLYGIFPVQAALLAQRRQILRLYHKQGHNKQQQIGKIVELAARQRIPTQASSGDELERKAGSPVHQGVVLEVGALPLFDLKNFLGSYPQARRILVLDQVLDPQNLGALVRTAVFFGFDAVLFPRKKSAPLSSAASKASAGMLEQLPCIAVANLSRSLEELKQAGFWIFGSDMEGEPIAKMAAHPPEKLALIMGNEGEGMRPLTRKHCDVLVGIATAIEGAESLNAESLNVSAAGAVLMHALRK